MMSFFGGSHLKSPARSHHVVVITDPRQCCSSKSYQTHASHSLLLGSLQADMLCIGGCNPIL